LNEFIQWPFFEDRHRELDGAIESFLPNGLPIDEGVDERATCRGLVRALGDGGWLDHAAPLTAGDTHGKLDVRSLCIVRERLAYHHGLADFAFAMQGLGSAPIRLFGSGELTKTYLPATREGSAIAAFALSEPEAGSDVSAIETTARLDGDEFVLNGTKMWISNGGLADYYVVFARSEDREQAPGTKGLSAFVVDQNSPGLEVTETIDVTAPHPLARLTFRDCRVPSSRLVGERGNGFVVAMTTLDFLRPTVGAAAVGFAKRALDESLAHVGRREQFGKKLADFQLTQAKLADMATGIDAASLLVYRAAWLKDRGETRVTRESSMAKMFATEMAQRAVDDAVQLFGAKGVVKGSIVERLYREVRALRIYEGTTEIHKLIIARELRRASKETKREG
jgi:alkylation response protein AidB-like acyl-CoA dehydrogenase